ncbi:hypothetical protein [Bacterioplanoides pacificum]|uniref:Uncharacterized protein n=1 Tax=Bacterioplanoides pacificum TaxID=1171596 RepID=A0ABV7VZV5_9GAMM
MKQNYHQILEYIYKNEEAGIREVSRMMVRKYDDHRDFYGLAALLKEGYIGFTGPIHEETLNQVETFQCYSQGEGRQTYGRTTLFSKNEDSYFYIGPKGISYFHQRWELRRGWYIVAVLTLVASIVSGVIIANLTDTNTNCAITNQANGTPKSGAPS